MIGKTLGQYRILKIIGTGASATVYLGEHVSIKRLAAVKVLHPHLSRDDSSIERLRREAQALAALSHDNIVKIYDVVLEKENAYIVFEYVEGGTLKTFLEERPDFPPELASALMTEICRAVAAAHELNIIHRDIKPENILITREGRVKLTDFGIARLTEMENMTLTGALIGSPNFMSPEQIECFPVDKTSDIFSLGVLFYHLLTRAYPFGAKSQAKIIRNVLEGRYIPPDAINMRVHPLAVRAVELCLKTRPEERFKSVRDLAAMVADLNRCFGFEDPSGEIRKCAAGWAEYRDGFEARLTEGLMRCGREGLAKRNRARALAAVNHVLLINRSHRSALILHRKIRSSGKWNTLVFAAAFIVAATALTFLVVDRGVKRAETRMQPAPQPAPALPDTSLVLIRVDTAPVPRPAAKHPRRRAEPPLPAAPAPVIPAPAPAAVPAVKYGVLKVYTKPWAKLYIDGEYKGKTPFVGDFTLTAGRHEVRMENPYCVEIRDTVAVAGDSITAKKYELRRMDNR